MKKVKKAIILAGGKGTRLYPVTFEIPKPLITIKREPIINYLAKMFINHGVENIAVVIRPEDKEEFNWWFKRWGGDLNAKIEFMEENEPMGTFGYWAHHLHNWTGDESFFFTNGDELKEIDLTALTEQHQKTGALATIAAAEVSNPSEYGVMVFSDNEGIYIEKFLEKPQNPPTNFISSGLYLLDPAVREYVLEDVKLGKKFLMIEKDIFPKLAADKKLAAYKFKGKWFDCGNLERWEKAIKEWDL